MNAAYRTVQVIGHHIATTGTALTEEIPSGDVVNTVAADAMRSAARTTSSRVSSDQSSPGSSCHSYFFQPPSNSV